MTEHNKSFYKDYPKTCAPDDFWGQIKRTVNGKPVSQDQIELIVQAVEQGLGLHADDTLLDLCCGNGALSILLFRRCKGGLGFDFSEYLIEVANKNFAVPGRETYVVGEMLEFCRNPQMREGHKQSDFTKGVCYGSFAYLGHEQAEESLRMLRENFPNLNKVFIGNCPDKDKIREFFGEREIPEGVTDDPNAPIGIWRTEEEFKELARKAGWAASIMRMPSQYYAAHYRYDVLLSRVK